MKEKDKISRPPNLLIKTEISNHQVTIVVIDDIFFF